MCQVPQYLLSRELRARLYLVLDRRVQVAPDRIFHDDVNLPTLFKCLVKGNNRWASEHAEKLNFVLSILFVILVQER